MKESLATILVVDDEEYIRKFIQRILEEVGFRVVAVSNGQEAIDKISSSNINLVLLDIVMPGMDGFQTLELIREKSEIPVIMVTGLGKATLIDTSLGIGADDYIKKPFRSGELVARIKAKLRRTKS